MNHNDETRAGPHVSISAGLHRSVEAVFIDGVKYVRAPDEQPLTPPEPEVPFDTPSEPETGQSAQPDQDESASRFYTEALSTITKASKRGK